uniref:RMDN1 n=1 Tax=Macrostomum lignano TaxID=282301 RepID=A0A1I8IZ21_9PLAT
RVWGSTLGRGGLLLLIAGSGLLTAAALHHFCKEPARRQLLDRLVRIGSSIKLCCGASGAAAALPHRSSRRLERRAPARGGKSATGAAAAAAPSPAHPAESTELLMECRNPPTPMNSARCPSIANTADPRQLGFSFRRRRCRRERRDEAGIRSLTLSMALASSKAADLVVRIESADGCGRTQRCCSSRRITDSASVWVSFLKLSCDGVRRCPGTKAGCVCGVLMTYAVSPASSQLSSSSDEAATDAALEPADEDGVAKEFGSAPIDSRIR